MCSARSSWRSRVGGAAVDAPAVVHVEGELPASAPSAPLSANGADPQGDVRVPGGRGVEALQRHRAALRSPSTCRPARSSGSWARTARARPRSSTCCRGSRSPARATSSPRERPSSSSGPTASPSGARAVVPGRAALPRPHRGRDDRCRARAQHRRRRSLGRGAPPPVGGGLRRPRWPNAPRSPSSCRSGAFRDKYIRELSTGSRRVVDLACVLAHQPRVLLLDEPSSGIAQREAEALGPLLLRIRAMTGRRAHHRARHPAAPVDRGSHDRARPGSGGNDRRTGRCRENPDVVASYLGESEAVVARSGPRGG